MNSFIRFYNLNRRKIWQAIIVVTIFIIIIRGLNYYAKINNQKKGNEINNTSAVNFIYEANKSVISDDKVDKNTFYKQNDLIATFVEYCNNKEVQKAYNLLTDECKYELYPTVQDFKSKYYDLIFSTKRTYSMNNWYDSIYIVKFTEDFLKTGKVNFDSSIQDYIEIVDNYGKKRLNINGFLGREIIEKKYDENGIIVNVIDKVSFMDYEIYSFEVENNTNYTLIIDSLDSDNTMYLTDKNNVKHYSINNEIYRDSLVVKSKTKKRINIKFDNPFISGRKIKKITFSKMILSTKEKSDVEDGKIISSSLEI